MMLRRNMSTATVQSDASNAFRRFNMSTYPCKQRQKRPDSLVWEFRQDVEGSSRPVFSSDAWVIRCLRSRAVRFSRRRPETGTQSAHWRYADEMCIGCQGTRINKGRRAWLWLPQTKDHWNVLLINFFFYEFCEAGYPLSADGADNDSPWRRRWPLESSLNS